MNDFVTKKLKTLDQLREGDTAAIEGEAAYYDDPSRSRIVEPMFKNFGKAIKVTPSTGGYPWEDEKGYGYLDSWFEAKEDIPKEKYMVFGYDSEGIILEGEAFNTLTQLTDFLDSRCHGSTSEFKVVRGTILEVKHNWSIKEEEDGKS